MAKHRLVVRIEVTPDTGGYTNAGLAFTLERSIEATDFMGVAGTVQPIIAVTEGIGERVKPR